MSLINTIKPTKVSSGADGDIKYDIMSALIGSDKGVSANFFDLTITIKTTDWDKTNCCTVKSAAIGLDSIIILNVAATATADQYDAVSFAKIICTSTAVGSCTLKALGDVPSIDVPITLSISGGINSSDKIMLSNDKHKMNQFYTNATTITTITDNFDANKLSVIDGMFDGMSSLTTIPSWLDIYIPNYYLSADNIFSDCTSLTIDDLVKIFWFNNAYTLYGTFSGCSKIKNINLNTNNAVMDNMFDGCTSLVRVAGNLRPNSVVEMFNGCTNLTTIDNLYMNNIEITSDPNDYLRDMFVDCTSLKAITFKRASKELKKSLTHEHLDGNTLTYTINFVDE